MIRYAIRADAASPPCRLAPCGSAGVGRSVQRGPAGQVPAERSGIVAVDCGSREPADVAAALRSAGVTSSVREGRLRVSCHLFVDEGDVERLAAALPS